jgi:hypothetical protein
MFKGTGNKNDGSRPSAETIRAAWDRLEQQITSREIGAGTFDLLALNLLNARLVEQGKPASAPAIIAVNNTYVSVDAVLQKGIDNLPGPTVAKFTRFGVSQPDPITSKLQALVSVASQRFKSILVVSGEHIDEDARDDFIAKLGASVPTAVWDIEKLKDIGLRHPEAIPELAGAVSSASSSTIAQAIQAIEGTDPNDPQRVAGGVFKLTTAYYHNVLSQADKAFYVAAGAAIVGTGFFIAAVAFVLISGRPEDGIISLVSGALIQVISLLVFRLYGETTKQLASFHLRLDDLQRSLVANSFCEALGDLSKDRARSDLIRAMIGHEASTAKVLASATSDVTPDLRHAANSGGPDVKEQSAKLAPGRPRTPTS